MTGARPRLPPQGLVLAAALCANAAVQQAAAAAGTADVVSGLGSGALLWLWPASMAVVALATLGLASLGDRVGRQALVVLALAFAALAYLGLQAVAWAGARAPYVSAALYLLTDLQLIVLPMAVWALANDLFVPAQGRQLFPLIGSGAVVGTVAGNLLAGAIGLSRADPERLLWLGALPLLAAAAGLWLRRRGQEAPRHAGAEPLRETVATFATVPMLPWLVGAFILVQVAMTVVEYHFLGVTRSFLHGRAAAMTAVLGATSLAVLALTALAQWRLSGRLMQWAQTKNAFPVMPVVLLAAALVLLGVVGFGGAVAAWGLSSIVLTAWDDPARKTVQGLLPQAQRVWAGCVIDILPYALGTTVASGLLALAQPGLRAALGPALLALAAAGALALAVRARSLYDPSLLHWRLSRGKRSTSNLLESLDLY